MGTYSDSCLEIYEECNTHCPQHVKTVGDNVELGCAKFLYQGHGVGEVSDCVPSSFIDSVVRGVDTGSVQL